MPPQSAGMTIAKQERGKEAESSFCKQKEAKNFLQFGSCNRGTILTSGRWQGNARAMANG